VLDHHSYFVALSRFGNAADEVGKGAFVGVECQLDDAVVFNVVNVQTLLVLEEDVVLNQLELVQVQSFVCLDQTLQLLHGRLRVGFDLQLFFVQSSDSDVDVVRLA